MDASLITQLVSAGSNIVLAISFGIGYYLIIRLYGRMLDEMRGEHLTAYRPQVLVEANYDRLPEVDLSIRNIGQGSATELTFEVSSRIQSSTGFDLSELPYFKRGLDFLSPDGEIRSYWDRLDSLIEVFKQRDHTEGIAVITRYQDLSGGKYEDRWTINPLLHEGDPAVRGSTMNDLVEAVEDVSRKLDGAARDDGRDRAPRQAPDF